MNCVKPLKEAVYHILCHKSIDKITVEEICRTAEVSKQTFYRYFTDKYALANAVYDDLFTREIVMRDGVPVEEAWEKTYLKQFKRFRQHLDFVKNIFVSQEPGCAVDHEIQMSLTHDKNMVLRKGGDVTDPYILFALQAWDVGGVNALKNWILGGMQVTDEDMIKRYRLIIPDILTPYFKEVDSSR